MEERKNTTASPNATPPAANSSSQSSRNSPPPKKKRGRSILRPLVFAVVVIAAAFGAYSLFGMNGDTDYGPGFARGNGRLDATEIDISTKMAGKITELRVDEGDYVTAGQVLGVMQLNVLEARLGEARAQLVQSKAALASAQAQIAVRQSEVSAAEATVAQRVSELDQTRRRLRRSSVLSERGVITGQQFDDDETTEMAAQAAVQTARAQVDVAKAGVESAKADAANAAAAVKAAEASVASVQADIDDSYLVAPRNGRVQYRVSQPGEVLAAGGKVLNFVDLNDVYMNFFLPSEQAGRVALGAEARIVLDAYSEYPLPATISYVAETAQFTPKTVETASEREKLMFRVKAKLDPELVRDREKYVKPGLPGVVWVRMDPDQPWPQQLRADGALQQRAAE